MSRSRGTAATLGSAVASTALVLLALTGCASGGRQHADAPASGTPTTPAPATTSPPAPSPPPQVGSCHRLSFAVATSPTDDTHPVNCRTRHNAVTYAVGTLHLVSGGHLLAVDSQAVQDQLARRCPAGLARYVGGDVETRRLSRLQAVWFGPSVEQGDLGARWFRCDVVALADQGRLAPLDKRMRGVLDRPGALDRWGTCGTAAPTAAGFRRVICSHRHAWQAVATIDLPAHTRFRGGPATADANSRCQDVARSRAPGSLKYTWSFEWPTRAQWQAGQRYGYCWVPG